MNVVRALLSECIDYAGLFPPAGLDLQTTVENYASCRAGSDAWALGRLVLPAGRIVEFAERWPGFAAEWPIALLLRNDVEHELKLAESTGVCIDSVECSHISPTEIAWVRQRVPPSVKLYVEVAANADHAATITALSAVGACAKIRTGGIQQKAIPPSAEVASFLSCCIDARVAFKATAGLHHPLRGLHPLTYDTESEQASMHGFLNVMLAATLLAAGYSVDVAISMLEETCLSNLRFDDNVIRWHEFAFSGCQLSQLRQESMVSFGSCSFLEPLEDLRNGGLLP